MATQITGNVRIKRRASGGAAGAPNDLKTSEIAYNESDDTVYIGFGDDGSGNATSVRAFAGAGTFATKQFVNDSLSGAGAGDMLKSVYDTNNDGKVDRADVADQVDWLGVQNPPSNATTTVSGFMTAADKVKLNGIEAGANNYVHPTGDGNQHVPATGTTNNGRVLKAGSTAGSASWQALGKSDVGLGNVDNTSDAAKPVSTATQNALDLKADLASPAFTGTPTAPTAAQATNNTQLATTAFVKAALAALIDGSPAALDTLQELAAALGNDPNFATTIATQIGEKMAKSANLSDVASVPTARTNLGLGTMATQDAASVAITGGSIDNVEIDGGTF